jgi:ABC-type lipoprotein release transport system permease subunit
MIFLKLGLRNLLRNKKRSILCSTAVGIGLACLLLVDGIMEGMKISMIKTATTGILGQGKLQHKNYKETQESNYYFPFDEKVKDSLKGEKDLMAFSPRLNITAMISGPSNSRNILLMGINPQTEKGASKLNFFFNKPDSPLPKGKLLIGNALLKELQMKVGEKVILTLSQEGTGELIQELYRIHDTFRLGSQEADKGIVFINLSEAQKMLGVNKGVHEVVLNLGNKDLTKIGELPLWKNLSRDPLVATHWAGLAPSIEATLELTGMSSIIVLVIISFILGLGVVNTLFMSIFDRLHEFGVLRALGTKGREIVLIITSESFFMGILSLVIGIPLALIFSYYLSIYGLDYSGIEFNNITFREPILYVFRPSFWLIYSLGTVFFTLIVGMYPALFATKLTMAEALKRGP